MKDHCTALEGRPRDCQTVIANLLKALGQFIIKMPAFHTAADKMFKTELSALVSLKVVRVSCMHAASLANGTT